MDNPKHKYYFCVAGFLAGIGLATVTLFGVIQASPDGSQSGTTLSAEKTGVGHWLKTFQWTIDKSVLHDVLNMFNGDSAAEQYTVTVTKDNGTETYLADGEICVTNGGAYATENLNIIDTVQYKVESGQFQDLVSYTVDLNGFSVLDPGANHCYPYSVTFTPVEGAVYKNVAHVTITNHAGWRPGGYKCPGPELCPFGPDPKVDISLPSTPTLVNDTITVNDTNGQTLNFSQSGSQTYEKNYACGADAGQHDNTAAITYNDNSTGPSDSASVKVNCYALDVLNGIQLNDPAKTSFTRTYNWVIAKTAALSNLTLALNQIYQMPYTVTVNASSTDSSWEVDGTFRITNPAPIPATINSVSSVVSPDIQADFDCGVDFPYSLAPSEILNCTYSAPLPDATARTYTITATIQNYSYDFNMIPTPTTTTNFSANENFNFDSAAINQVDESIDVTDSLQGSLGSATVGPDLPKVFTYNGNIGPYTACGDPTVNNTASFETNYTGATGTANWTVNVHVPCSGCSLTIGYWKNHAGFGPQSDMLTRWLPILLGTTGGAKSVNVTTATQAVTLLSFSGNASNGINKLYAQLLAAQLNIKNGASGTAVAATITAANNFLSTKNANDWPNLTKAQKNQVLGWMTTLDNFNNGLIGPGHCSE